MSFDLKRLYELLPALYRIRDTELGIKQLSTDERSAVEQVSGELESVQGPLKSLLSIIAEQVAVLEENLDQLYDDQFIETCAEWAVSYIGALVGTRGLLSIPGASFSERGEVANTIGYRRRKGTASVIEQLARDVTSWDANVVEYFQLLATTQYLNHRRPENLSLASLKNWEALEYANTPFDKMAHTVDVRRIEKKRGKYNIQNIGIYLWRLRNFSLTRSPAYKVDDRRYTFDPLGKNIHLYNVPETEDTITHLAEPVNVPMPVSRRVLANYLERHYGEDKEGKDKSLVLYADGNAILPDEKAQPEATLQDLISVCDLSDVFGSGGTLTGWAHMPLDKIAIDPVLGRIAFPATQPPPANVHVTFNYGFSAEMGGGEYGRSETFADEPETKIIEVRSGGPITIQEALDQLFFQLTHEEQKKKKGVVEILDNEYYFETPIIRVPEGKTIELRAADRSRPILVLEGELLIEAEKNGSVILNGLLLSGGRIRLPLRKADGQPNGLQLLRLLHCTLPPGPSPAIGAIAAQPSIPRIVVEVPDAVVEIEKTISGALRVFDGAAVSISNSIIDAMQETAVAYAGLADGEAGGTLTLTNTTVIGRVYTMLMKLASNSIFMAGGGQDTVPVKAQRLQQGCVRFSYIPLGSKLPLAYHCQPSASVDAVRVRPVFTSLQYGDAGYGQLSTHCAVEITQGADDEAEMGAFHDLYQPQREANLRTRLDEYLRFGLEAGIFYAS
jgi:hypothetical protein